jgi:hypothetical protein
MAASPELQLHTRVGRSPEMPCAIIDGMVAMLGIQNGRYYGLRGVGTRIWELLECPRTVGELVAILQQEYEVDPADCHSEVLCFMRECAREKLIVPIG